MNITGSQIKQIIDSSATGPYRVADKLAPLEMDRLAGLILNVLDEFEEKQKNRPQITFEQWSVQVRGLIIDSLEESKDILGNLNLMEMLNLSEMLKQIYQSQS